MKKAYLAAVIALMALLLAYAASAATFDQVLARWTKSRTYSSHEQDLSSLEIKATYYSAEFIEAYVQNEAQKNMWTQQEAEDYKINFLKALRLDETIPIMIDFNNNGQTMYLGPFDIMVKLRIGNKLYKPVDYDKRFNFKFQGKKNGLVYFPRYDEKTGKDLLKGVKSVVLEMPSAISTTLDGRNVSFMWDVANDDPSKLYQGRTASRFETDRLLKRLDKLKKDKSALEAQMKSVTDEMTTIQNRLDELAKQ